jgi:hypothetical protein
MGAKGSTYDDKAQVKTALHKFGNMKLRDFEDLWRRFKDSGLGFALHPTEVGELLMETNERTLRDVFTIFDNDERGLVDSFELITTLALCSSMRLEEKLRFVQSVYDFNENSMFSKDEITIIARTALYGIAKADVHSQSVPLETSHLERFSDRAYETFKIDEDEEISGELLVEFCSKDPEAMQFINYCNGLLAPVVIASSTEVWTDKDWDSAPERVYIEPIAPPVGTLLPEGIWWRHLSEICPAAPVLFADGVQPSVAIPGKLSNEWFLDAANMLLTRPRYLSNLFVPTTQEDAGRYCVRFWKDGNWERVVVDSNIPCDSLGEPLYATSEDPSQIWPYIIEKAYAKLHGTYEVLGRDSVDYALTDLTGGRVERIPLKKASYSGVEKHEMWERLEKLMLFGILGASHRTDSSDDARLAAARQAGIVVGHTYAVVELIEDNRGERSVRLRSRQLPRMWTEGVVSEPKFVNEKLEVEREGKEDPVAAEAGNSEEGKGEDAEEGKVAAPLSSRSGKSSKSATPTTIGTPRDRTFLVAFDTFLKHTNMLRYVHVWGEEWISKRHLGEWTERKAGGCVQHPTWKQSTQFAVEVFEEEGCEVSFELYQPDGRYHMAASVGETLTDLADRFSTKGKATYEASIGMLLVKHDWGGPGVGDDLVHHLQRLVEEDVVELTFPFQHGRSVRIEPRKLEQGKYILIPMTFEPKFYSKYTVIARSRKQIEFADHLDMRWDEANPDDEDEDEDDGGQKGGDDLDLKIRNPGIDIVEAVEEKDRFFTPEDSEKELNLEPEYKAIQGMHTIIWNLYTEIESLRQRRSAISNRLAGLEQ